MIVKMKFLSITGPKGDFDRVTNTYLSKYEVQLENALSELKTVNNLTPFAEINPYKDALLKANEFVTYLEDLDIAPAVANLADSDLFSIIRTANHDYMDVKMKENALKAERESLLDKLKIIQPFKGFQFDLHTVLQYRYIKFRFGRVPVDYFRKLEKYIYEDLNVVFLEGGRDINYVYGVYFVSKVDADKSDAIFKSLHFERLHLPDDYDGHPANACHQLESKIQELSQAIDNIGQEITNVLLSRGPQLLTARDMLEMLSTNFDVRKVAACVEEKQDHYYILCGWMAEDDVAKFLKDIKNDDDIFVVVEDDKTKFFGEPPTKLKNPKFFKPFEMFVKMYGLPAHNEMDPTIFIALTYTFIFGWMFGDVGQGLVLCIGGGLLYKFKGVVLAGIISIAGIFSTFFGFMFGSVFGFENIIEARWLHPMTAMTSLPFIGSLNTVFIVAIVFGMALILLTMILHIGNAIKAHDTESAIFDTNGVIGFVFYLSLVIVIFLFMLEKTLPASIVLAVMFGLPLLLILLREPIVKKIEKQTFKPESMGMFVVEGLFELFETLLSYFSNTLSFVRIGAFAISHAAMMEVVLMLAGAEHGIEGLTFANWAIIILGNVFVCGMEGLIVGIQVLRLEYYEMFSRFYKGTGREFSPYINVDTHKEILNKKNNKATAKTQNI
ncbi:MAG: V-type ATPase 116kDa subunit family protein [Eubacteriales bacterium]